MPPGSRPMREIYPAFLFLKREAACQVSRDIGSSGS